MPKISEEPLVAIQLRLFAADLETLRRLYGQSTGVNKAVRTIVRTFLRQADAKAAAMIDANEAAERLIEDAP